jgi:mannan endo-1,4-beta-mannosidase
MAAKIRLVLAVLAASLAAPTYAAAGGWVHADGTHLVYEGKAFAFTGLNVYNASSNDWCWYSYSATQLNESFAQMGVKVIRVWWNQALATTNGQRDWSRFDRLMAAARRDNVWVIPTLGSQWGECGSTNGYGDLYKDAFWYQAGYTLADPAGTVSYRDWVKEVVGRYRNDQNILFWQLMNEAEVKLSAGSGTCAPNAAQLLQGFAADVGGLVHSIDHHHLVNLGTIGSGQCGAQGGEYEQLYSVPAIDICEYHDYDSSASMPGDQWNGLAVRIHQCNDLGKPLFVGELGVNPQDVGGTLAARAAVVRSKLQAMFGAGVAGVVAWAWNREGSTLGNYDIGPGDPELAVLRGY